MRVMERAAVAIVLMSILLWWTTRDSMAVGQGPSSLGLQQSVQKSEFVLNEPVYLSVILENAVTWDIEAEIIGLSLYEKHMRVYIEENGTAPVRYYDGPILDFLGDPTRVFAPGESIADVTRIYHNDLTGHLAFPHTGQYQVYVKVYLGNYPDPVYKQTTPTTINIIDPQEPDLRLIDAIGTESDLVTLLRWGPLEYCDKTEKQQCVNDLLRVVSSNPRSSYAPTLLFDLASSAETSGNDRSPDYGLRATLLKDFVDRWSDHPLVAAAMSQLAYALYKSGRDKEALEWMDTLESKYPGYGSPRRAIVDSEDDDRHDR